MSGSHDAPAGPGLSRRAFLTLGLSWLAAANCRAPLMAIGPLLPLIIVDLQLSSTVAGALGGLPVLVMGLTSYPSGLLGDRVGPRRLLVATQLGIALFGGMRGLAENSVALLLASAALGMGVGGGQPALVQVARAVSHRYAGIATAVYANGLMLGVLISVVITVPLLLPLAGGSWRGALLMWAALGVVTVAGWLLAAPKARTGSGTLHRHGPGIGEVVRIPGFISLTIIFATQSVIFYAVSTWLPEYYVQQGWTLVQASVPLVVLSVSAIAAGVVAPASALLLHGPRWPSLASGVLSLLGPVGLAVLPELAFVWAAVIGIGTGAAFALSLAAPAELAPADKVGAAAGFMLAIGYLASMLGPFGVGVFRDLTGSFVPGLAFLAAAGGLMAAASLGIPMRRRG